MTYKTLTDAELQRLVLTEPDNLEATKEAAERFTRFQDDLTSAYDDGYEQGYQDGIGLE